MLVRETICALRSNKILLSQHSLLDHTRFSYVTQLDQSLNIPTLDRTFNLGSARESGLIVRPTRVSGISSTFLNPLLPISRIAVDRATIRGNILYVNRSFTFSFNDNR